MNLSKIKLLFSLSISKTMRYNFHYFGIKGWKFPVLVFRNYKLKNQEDTVLNGKCEHITLEELGMNVAFCSLLLPEEKHLSEWAKERLSGISSHKFEWQSFRGVDANLQSLVTVFNIINTLNYPKFPALIFPTER